MRFDEFTTEWKQFSLRSISERVTRRNKNNETTLPLTISAQYGLIDQSLFFDRKIASKDMKNYYLLLNGEFAYNKSYSNDYAFGTVKRLDLYPMGALSSLYFCFKPHNDICSDFLVHYFETSKWHRGISDIAGEGARNHGLLNMSVEDYFDTKHYLPQLSEQEKIASLFNSLTQRIEAQSKIIEKLQSQMKGICNRIFARNKTKKLEDCLICKSSTLLEAQVEMMTNGDYAVYGATGIVKFINTFENDKEAILILKDGANVGKVQYADAYHSVIGTSNYFFPKAGINLKYIYYALLAFDFQKFKVGSGIPHIYFKDYKDEKIYFPPDDEQQQIIKLLSCIEQKISVESTLLDKLKEQKKFLLSNMFI